MGITGNKADMFGRSAGIARMARGLFGLVVATGFAMPGTAHAADPHVCYKRVHVPAATRLVRERVLISPGATVETFVPPAIHTEHRRVVTQTSRAHRAYHPPQSRIVKKRVLVEHARTLHKPCIRHGRHATCAVHIPARYATRVFRHDITPGRMVTTHTAPRVRSVEVHRPVRPAYRRQSHVAPRYKTVTRRVVTKPAHMRHVRTSCGH